jgi:pimeloyl-ACP methyl ester carboxylesterase
MNKTRIKSSLLCLCLFGLCGQYLPATCQTPATGQTPGQAAVSDAGLTGLPVDKSSWHGYDRYDFVLDVESGAITPSRALPGEGDGVGSPAKGQRRCILVVPRQAAAGHPWSWQACYWNHQPQTEVELLRRGFCIAYISAGAGLEPDKNWETWYAFLTGKYELSPKPVFIGMSRGGTFEYMWATTHPDAVSCIYADNPAIAPESLMKLGALASRDVPLLNVCGSIDPLLGNHTLAIESIYQQLGGRISVMIKEGFGHHPHSLKDARPIADWIEQNYKTVAAAPPSGAAYPGAPPAGNPPATAPPALVGARYVHTNYYSIENTYTYSASEGTYISSRGPWFSGCYDRYQFNVAGIDGAITLTLPKTAAPGKPWVFRVGFAGRDAVVDLALLAKGYTIVTGPVSYNSDSLSLKDWNAVYKLFTDNGYSPKPAVEGAGGAAGQAYGWAIANPEKVSCIYAENPFLRSTFSAEQPLENLAVLAKARIPILHVCGSLDPALKDQTEAEEKRYKALGGSIRVIIREGQGHYPSGPEDVDAVVNFIQKSAH